MAHLLQRFVEPPRRCSYLPEKKASLEIRYMIDVTPLELEAMLIRGWRRFGPAYFRPLCAGCFECVSIRIPTATFTPSRAQKRALKHCSQLRIEIGPPSVDEQRLALYHRWHHQREEARGWEPSTLDDVSYATEFAFPHPCGREVAFYDDEADGKLVGLGICDETPNCWSAVYFFYDPDYAKWSLGTANVMVQLAYATQKKIPHVYLGYRVQGCPSLLYKTNYRPYETLHGRPAFDATPAWVPGEPSTLLEQ